MQDAVYNIGRMRADMVRKGWLPIDLARRARVSDMCVYRFLDGTHRTARTAKKLARALGHSLSRYLAAEAVA